MKGAFISVFTRTRLLYYIYINTKIRIIVMNYEYVALGCVERNATGQLPAVHGVLHAPLRTHGDLLGARPQCARHLLKLLYPQPLYLIHSIPVQCASFL